MTENRIEFKKGEVFDKQKAIDLVDKWRFDLGFSVEELNGDKPWGAYWKLPNWQAEQFMFKFFPRMLEQPETLGAELSPKLLLVEPGEMLSWQYHGLRDEDWRVIAGEVGIKTSDTDFEPVKAVVYKTGQSIHIEQGKRHRLVGLSDWALVAEIWTHTDPTNPSKEEDIVRLADKYTREN